MNKAKVVMEMVSNMFRTRRLFIAVNGIVLFFLMTHPSMVRSQERLTDGLLEELDRSEKTKPTIESARPEDPGKRQAGSDGLKEPVSLDAMLHESVRRLMRGDVSKSTLDLQDSIVEQLDTLIRSIDESQRDAKGAKPSPTDRSQSEGSEKTKGRQTNGEPNGEPTQTMRMSNDENGTDEGAGEEKGSTEVDALMKQVQFGAVQDLQRRVWGHLPEKVRRKMEAAAVERFLPSYQKSIEEYYRRLNRERGNP